MHLVDISATIHKNLDESIMYDDYDLDYTMYHDNAHDLDETYDIWVQSFAHTQLDEDLDEEYARDAQDYDALAYKHYA